MTKRKSLIKAFRNKDYREAFVSELINTGIPFQIIALREQREWTQGKLGEKANMLQPEISRIEDPNYGKLSIATLKRIASAFDIGLLVKFVPFSDLVEQEVHLSPDSLRAVSFEDDPYFKENLTRTEIDNIDECHNIQISTSATNVLSLLDYKTKKEDKATIPFANVSDEKLLMRL